MPHDAPDMRQVGRPGAGISRRGFLRLGGGALAGAALLGGTLAGCGGESGGGAAGGAIKVASWNIAADALKEVVPAFEEKYPEASASVQYITFDYEQLIPRLQAGAGAPDVFSVGQQDFQNFLMRFPDQFVDLTGRMERYRDQFAPAPLATVEKGSKTYGVPWDMGPIGLFYREDYFEEAGVDPASLTTYDRFIEAGQELQERLPDVKMTAIDATGTGGNPATFFYLLNQLGGSFYDDEGRIDFTNEKSYRAMDLVRRIKEAGIYADAPTYDEWTRVVSNGDAATSISAVWDAGTIKSSGGEEQQGKWNVMPLPAFEEGGSRQATAAGSVLVVSSQSQSPDAAWNFIEQALLTNEGQDKSWKYGLFPSWRPYWETESFNEPDPYFGFPVAPKFVEIARDVPPLEFGAHFLDFQKPLGDAYAAVLTGNASPEEALARAEERAASATDLEIA
jgi:lactose/L-arabinose transport system substrate-binding protein